jgi:hypothetical protein
VRLSLFKDRQHAAGENIPEPNARVGRAKDIAMGGRQKIRSVANASEEPKIDRFWNAADYPQLSTRLMES